MSVTENIICGLVVNAIYDIVKYVINVFNHSIKPSEKIKINISNSINMKLSNEWEILQNSATLEIFINSSQFFDIINSYLIYKILGISQDKIKDIKKSKKKKSNNILTIDDLSESLTTKILAIYLENKTLVKPDKIILNKFFRVIIECAEETIFKEMNFENKGVIYYINSHFDVSFNNIDNILTELQNDVKRLLDINIVKSIERYDMVKKEYYNILKTKNSEAHIYLLDKFDFDKFYVPPILMKDLDKQFYFINNLLMHEKNSFDKWRYIFDQRNIIYIVGGAGYGKSLFMKKIINDYVSLNLFHSEEYLVIYGELKMFYPNNSEIPISVTEFLRNSMKTSTLLNEDKITLDFVEHYLNSGRCIILLDALDEVDKTKRNILHESIISFFKNQNPNNKICITSRNRGFIPEKDIEVFHICPLNDIQIETYVDKIIGLGKFESADKSAFMKQTSVLVKKGFLNSFLVLSLLINIYKSERELPENKLELYQKCFEYIANKREKDKMQTRYNWQVISPMMKDYTFIELAEMCYPNNTDVDKTVIKDKLVNTYKSKYGTEVDTENAIEEFLKFCSDRTELFVPASGEDKFKFFHRSFFEYFYSQYIFYRCNDINDILTKLLQFDIDSEVFELTVAMLKQKAENNYQKLIELMIERSKEEFCNKNTNYPVFNILILSMQVVDDILYRNEFLNLLLNNKDIIIIKRELFHNMHIINEVFAQDIASNKKICEQYYKEALVCIMYKAIMLFEVKDNIVKGDSIIVSDKATFNIDQAGFHLNRKNININININDFYVNAFMKSENILSIICNLDLNNFNKIYKKTSLPQISYFPKKLNKFLKAFKRLEKDKKEIFCKRLIMDV